VLSALEENELGPNEQCVRFLIIKSWQKPNKIKKFYHQMFQQLNLKIESTIVLLKGLIIIHNYLKKGPFDSLNTIEHNVNICEQILIKIMLHRKLILHIKQESPKDSKRSDIFSKLIIDYSKIIL